MDECYRTRMGVRFFNTTMPEIADELERLNRNLEALVKALERQDAFAEERCPDVTHSIWHVMPRSWMRIRILVRRDTGTLGPGKTNSR